MLPKVSLVIAIAACLSMPANALAASPHASRHVVRHWHGYGFLPGYQQPPNNSVPMYRSRESIRGTPNIAPSYWYGGGWYYFGEPALPMVAGMAAASVRAGPIRLSG